MFEFFWAVIEMHVNFYLTQRTILEHYLGNYVFRKD